MNNQEKRTIILGCLVECPFHTGNPTDCQYHTSRLLPMKDRLLLIRQMTNAEVDDSYQKHIEHLHTLENP